MRTPSSYFRQTRFVAMTNLIGEDSRKKKMCLTNGNVHNGMVCIPADVSARKAAAVKLAFICSTVR